ncbi:hypothetical protein EAJ14_21345 [Parabacteroides distasonis]|uniref:DUF1642 domain-containing protein n=3 Tax=Pseudomonadati TaxID=3379134 RepID=A0A7K0GNS4_PARDI|nr:MULTISPECIES: hypothetical protein [Bacteria]KAA4145383.1 hypothetical protein F3D31_26305 [Bacteroides ovatus]KAB3574166.1 hypothetical protein GAY07_23570 [Phocaeicola vulgatus]MTN58635.1 hypothetical protein [Turicibacter sanguinis]KAB5270514.1 hypothetical protein F9953_17855 [Bacteroides stercoris]KAB5306249.1 hypothetical protein F9939_17920 [Bacteroides stercoris]
MNDENKKAYMPMTEKLGVLLLELPNSWYRYIFLMEPTKNKLSIWETDEKEEVIETAFKCTQEEAQKYQQFRWVSLEEQ